MCTCKLQLVHTWPVEKAGNFPFQKGKKNFPKYTSVVYNKLVIVYNKLRTIIEDYFQKASPGFYNIYFHFLLNIIRASLCSYFVLIFLPNLSFDVLIKCVLIKKGVYVYRNVEHVSERWIYLLDANRVFFIFFDNYLLSLLRNAVILKWRFHVKKTSLRKYVQDMHNMNWNFFIKWWQTDSVHPFLSDGFR